MQAETIPKATLTHRQWHLNYGHSIAESVFEVYSLACAYLQSCNLGIADLVPVFVDRPGGFGWTGAKGNWRNVLAPAAEALQCFFPMPALWAGDTALHSKVSCSHCSSPPAMLHSWQFTARYPVLVQSVAVFLADFYSR